MNEFDIADLNQPLSSELLEGRKSRIKTVQDIIAFCQERDLQPVIVIPPVHRTLNDYFTPTFVNNYITSFIEELKVPSVKILDYLNHPSYSRDEYFRDAYYMNKQGAREFTKQVLEDLAIKS